eukprot:CAMPEP_0117421172 /NCGR_PEP_ID=MMETSP0758-20121206/2333_1 /TAXON_ID=63605 /ORGANISM="Percolomonas cosmopolitus, Strain AE-1 (ATCC 50343)" /LENGTH=146 /DNA_ID=CAMNT_0005203169 /DNA_START=503 /DNA_END=940 /DNA_ORIENTATION=+
MSLKFFEGSSNSSKSTDYNRPTVFTLTTPPFTIRARKNNPRALSQNSNEDLAVHRHKVSSPPKAVIPPGQMVTNYPLNKEKTAPASNTEEEVISENLEGDEKGVNDALVFIDQCIKMIDDAVEKMPTSEAKSSVYHLAIAHCISTF